jgi:microsomal dipeptidase-like Zn-dependent dipeptidase
MRRAATLLVLLAAAVFVFGPGVVQSRLNGTDRRQAQAPSDAAQRLHASLFWADMHADALLWGADLLKRQARGHVDVPRLVEGGVAIQGFSVVTQTPRGLNYEKNDAKTDDVIRLALLQLWPPRTYGSLLQRALYQAERLRGYAARSDGRLRLLLTREDLDAYAADRARQPLQAAAFLAIEGAHALDGDAKNVDALFEAGYRMMAPTHFFDNAFGGSAHGVDKGGLTVAGREMIRRMESRGMVLDLAHASPRTFSDAIAASTRPVAVSHTGVQATCAGVRNLTDDQLRAVAQTGGVVGIGFWDSAVCGHDAASIVRALRHAVDVAGIEHVGFGSDWDGAVTTPFDAAQAAELTSALLAAGFSEREIRLVSGENVARLLKQVLPARPSS